jgi:hypothetical protein
MKGFEFRSSTCVCEIIMILSLCLLKNSSYIIIIFAYIAHLIYLFIINYTLIHGPP